MRPHPHTGKQSTLTQLLFILFASLSLAIADPARKPPPRPGAVQNDFFPAFHVDKTVGIHNPVPDTTMTPLLAYEEDSRTNTTGFDDDIIVSDESEDDEDDDSYEAEDESDEDDEEEEDEEEEEEGFRADVRSLSDLPLSKLLQVRGELHRIEEDEVAETRSLGSSQPSLASAATAALGAAAAAAFNPQRNKKLSSSNIPNAFRNAIPNAHLPTQYSPSSPPEKMKTVDSSDSKGVPPRRGGWHFEEEEEEVEHEEDHGWMSSWHKGKKKKGDIGSVFQLSVTFLAFLAFGGYLLCLIVHAVKGGGPTGPSGEGYRPAMAPMVLMMPARLGVRRPRPPNPGRRRRRKRRRRRDTFRSPDEDIPWPTWTDAFEAEGSGRLWPNVDLENLQRILFDISRELAENGPILR